MGVLLAWNDLTLNIEHSGCVRCNKQTASYSAALPGFWCGLAACCLDPEMLANLNDNLN